MRKLAKVVGDSCSHQIPKGTMGFVECVYGDTFYFYDFSEGIERTYGTYIYEKDFVPVLLRSKELAQYISDQEIALGKEIQKREKQIKDLKDYYNQELPIPDEIKAKAKCIYEAFKAAKNSREDEAITLIAKALL